MREEIEGESELTPPVFFWLHWALEAPVGFVKTPVAGLYLKVSDSVRLECSLRTFAFLTTSQVIFMFLVLGPLSGNH